MTLDDFLFLGWLGLFVAFFLFLIALALMADTLHRDLACCARCHIAAWVKRWTERRRTKAAFPKARIVKQ